MRAKMNKYQLHNKSRYFTAHSGALRQLLQEQQAGRGRTLIHMLGKLGANVTGVRVPGAFCDVAIFIEYPCKESDINFEFEFKRFLEFFESYPDFYPCATRAMAKRMANRGKDCHWNKN